MTEAIIEQLKDDAQYYGEFGKQFLSNSDIYTLLREPKKFLEPKESTLPMLHGSYLHTAILEPHKLDKFEVIDASTRNTKVYKEAKLESGKDWLLLAKEKEDLDKLTDEFLGNQDFADLLLLDENRFEVPGVKEIEGFMWKGKCDVLGPELILDIKTTSNLDKFHYSARDYNYDSQAYIYNQIFGLPMVYLVIEKGSGRMNKYECSDDFYITGKHKMLKAMEIYNKYFAPDAKGDIRQHYETKTL